VSVAMITDENTTMMKKIFLPTLCFSRLHLHGLTFHSGMPVLVVAVGVVFLYAEVGVLISRPLGV
jgi:hypothetical protein